MSDENEIRNVVQLFFDCMYESNAEKARAAFHPNARICGYLGAELHEMTTSEFADFVASHQPSPKEQGAAIRLDILSIEIAGATAVARVRDDYLGMTFLDTLSLLKSDGAWSIYSKLFHVEAVEG